MRDTMPGGIYETKSISGKKVLLMAFGFFFLTAIVLGLGSYWFAGYLTPILRRHAAQAPTANPGATPAASPQSNR